MVAELKDEKSAPGAPPFPIATVVTTFLLLGFFAGLVWFVYTWSAGLNKAPDRTGESKLNELKAAQESIIRSGEIEKGGKTARIPIDRAMKIVSEKLGKQLPYAPMAPAAPAIAPKVEEPAKKDEPKAEVKKDEPKAEVKKDEPAKK